MSEWKNLCVRPGTFLLPRPETDLNKYAVVACDQYTAQPEYWEKADHLVGGQPSALRMILPECYLSDSEKRIEQINRTMNEYLQQDILSTQVNGMVLLRRTTKSGSRLGLLMCVDLEKYDFSPDSTSQIRATEGTILSRIPPRLQIREHAPLELSHVLLLADDPGHTIIEPIFSIREKMEKLYDITLMQDGGQLEGWAVTENQYLQKIYDAIFSLQNAAGEGGIVFAVGDGNHSLATARTHWLNVRKTLSDDERESHPTRFAMVELTNLHDPALQFEPIHRVLFDVSASRVKEMLAPCAPVVDLEKPDVVLVHEHGDLPLRFIKPCHTLPVGCVQMMLDQNKGISLDYVHGEDAVRELVEKQHAVGLLLPPMDKGSLFPSVCQSGALPRKTFSMGEANEKRYYVEARKIVW